MIERIAVMLHHGLGDVICAMPALWASDRLLGAKAVFNICVKSPLEAEVLHAVPWVGNVRLHYLPGGSRARRTIRTLAAARALRDAHPHVFLAPHVASPLTGRMVAGLVGAPLSILPTSDPNASAPRFVAARSGEHKVQYYARYFIAAGLPIDLSALGFPPVDLDSFPASASRARVVIAPGVGAPLEQHKRWPEASFAELVTRIARDLPGTAIELFGAPQEKQILERVYANLLDAVKASVVIITPLTPALAAKALVGATCVVTSCSGASHLAAWAGVPVVGIYGPTNPGYTGPYSNRLYVVRKGWACSPCYRPGFQSGCGTPVCMTDISVGEVWGAVVDAIAGRTPIPIAALKTTMARHPDRRLVLTSGPHGTYCS